MNSITSSGRILEKTLALLCAMVTIMLGVIFINVYAPSIESQIFPIIKEFKVSSVEPVSDKEILLRGSFNKLRSECRLDSLVAYTTNSSNTLKIPAKVDFLGVDSGNITFRIVGNQGWGPWKITSDVGLDNSLLSIISYHNCHGMYLIPTNLANVPINYASYKEIDH